MAHPMGDGGGWGSQGRRSGPVFLHWFVISILVSSRPPWVGWACRPEQAGQGKKEEWQVTLAEQVNGHSHGSRGQAAPRLWLS